MPVTDLDIVILRAQLAGDEQVAQMATNDRLGQSGDLSGLALLVYAAFTLAARRYFPPGSAKAEVVRYVAHVRALAAERPALLDPLAAEDELWAALGGMATRTHDIGAVASARLFILLALVASLDLDDDSIFTLLYQARDVANRTPGVVADQSLDLTRAGRPLVRESLHLPDDKLRGLRLGIWRVPVLGQ